MSNMKHTDTKFMQRCIELANYGKGIVSPNPMVGCVIVHRGKIIGEGYHHQYGGPHAEVNAIASVKNKSLLKEASLYVNLEPCSHIGKTPPCADLIINQGIPRVVIAMKDPHDKVAGKGIDKLKNAGISVTSGILEKTALELNKRFVCYHTKKRPFVVLKWAQTRDGFIDIERSTQSPNQPTWISNEISRTLVHKWRTEEQSILVGTNTALKDNPGLNIRDWHGEQPLRLVIDKHLQLTANYKLLNKQQPTIIYNQKTDKQDDSIEYKKITANQSWLPCILTDLYQRNITSVFVEGGKKLLQHFIDSGLWDEARVFIGNNFFGSGVLAPQISATYVKETKFDEDTLFVYKNT